MCFFCFCSPRCASRCQTFSVFLTVPVAGSRICQGQLLTRTCVRLPLSAPSVTLLRLFDPRAQKKHDILWPARIYHSASAESQAPPVYEIKEGGGGWGVWWWGGLPSFLAGSLRHDVTLQREMNTVVLSWLVWGRGLVALRRGGCEGLIVPMMWRAAF